MAETQNLMDGIFEQMNRAREIKKMYDEIPQGRFGSIMIQQAIDRAEKSIKDNDVIQMLSAFKELQEIE
jgi:hypothetical protein